MPQHIATRIVSTLQKAGHIAYFAGGWVRDFLLKRPSDDIDIATSASVEQVQALFPKTIPVGIAFGIIIVVEEGHQFEVASFRKEQGHLDGRRPSSIEPASPEEDAKRRDFTINGMFFDPLTNQLLDFVGGQKDLQEGVIRAIGDPHERFLEDRLRMIRAVRYSTRFHFSIEVDTEQAIISHAQSLFPCVAIERVWQEFQKMSQFANFSESLKKLYDLRLLQTIFPSLKEISPNDLQDRLAKFPLFPPSTPLIIEILHLFPEDSLAEHLELCSYLKLSNKNTELVRFFHRAKSLLSQPLVWQKKISPFEWTHFYAHPMSSFFLLLYSDHASFHREKIATLSPYIDRIKQKKPLLKAEDLEKEQIAPSPLMGKLLKEAEELSINEQITDKKMLMDRLKKSPLWP
jgi:poly(A) polymerase